MPEVIHKKTEMTHSQGHKFIILECGSMCNLTGSLYKSSFSWSDVTCKRCMERNPFYYQDTHQENVIHDVNWSKGNSYRYILEGAGDVFREITKGIPHKSYIEEKLRRIEEHINDVNNPPVMNADEREYLKDRYGIDPKITGIHPEDSFQYSKKHNPDRFKVMVKMWERQPIEVRKPTETLLQRKAVNLNLAMLKGDFYTAAKLIKEIRADLD